MTTHTFRVGRKHLVVMRVAEDGGFCAEWHPEMPPFLTRRMKRDYRRGRAALMQRVARQLGGAVVVAESDGQLFRYEAEERLH